MREMRLEREREREREEQQHKNGLHKHPNDDVAADPSLPGHVVPPATAIHPLVLLIFLVITWISLRVQRISHTLPHSSHRDALNLVRFHSSHVAKDNCGWLFDPIALAPDSGISGGVVTCASLHVGEIRPGKRIGNHRHHDCNETFLIWDAATRFRETYNVGSSPDAENITFNVVLYNVGFGTVK